MKYFKNQADQKVYGYNADTQQELIDVAIAAGWQDITGSWPPAPTDDIYKAQCKAQAKQFLLDTDFSQAADVAAVLVNKDAFDGYRALVRTLFLSPVVDPEWPTAPNAVWAV